jgi:protein transport protein SEC31
MPIFELFSNEMQRIKSKAPASYQNHVIDTEKRLNILFDLLNNSDRSINEDIVNRLKEIAMAVQSRDHAGATNLHTETMKALGQGSNWMVSPHQLVVLRNKY